MDTSLISKGRKLSDKQEGSTVTIGLISMSRAEKAFQDALKLVPGDMVANHNLAAIAVRKSDFSEARKYYKQVLKYDKSNLPTLLKIATLEALSNNKEAMAIVVSGWP